MQSGYKILWSEKAVKDLNDIINYLTSNWSGREVNIFVRKLDKRLDLISIYPKLFPKSSEKKNIRKSVLTKHITIYYLFDKNDIKIITLFNSRQKPEKLSL